LPNCKTRWMRAGEGETGASILRGKLWVATEQCEPQFSRVRITGALEVQAEESGVSCAPPRGVVIRTAVWRVS
jgi:hypothetical protein